MSESTISLTFDDLLQVVGRYLGYGASSSTYSTAQKTRIGEIINSGYRRFITPPVLDGETTIHEWSFLTITTTIATVDGDGETDLPDDFGGLIGDFTWGTGYMRAPITVVADAKMRDLRTGNTQSGYPLYVAIRNKTFDQTAAGQRFELAWWPEPDDAYTLGYTYSALYRKLDSTYLYPLGGAYHAETIRAACLSVAEEEDNDVIGAKNAIWKERLRASIASDRQRMTPDYLGYNGNVSRRDTQLRPRDTIYSEYEGNVYP